ncbi:MAG: hypothetical protein JWQ07_1795 [Ramlibacter sp.]|nr:hypothetical protein [Ramlibacter sp.]
MKFLPLRLALPAVLLGAALSGGPVIAQPAVAATQPVLPVAPVAPAVQPLPASRWTAAQVRQAFELADSDSNGELTRAEAQRLPIMPRSFEDTDQNKDGVITRNEYEAAFTR